MDSRAKADTNGVTNYPIYKLFGRTWRKIIMCKISLLNIRDIMILAVFWLYFGYSMARKSVCARQVGVHEKF